MKLVYAFNIDKKCYLFHILFPEKGQNNPRNHVRLKMLFGYIVRKCFNP